MTRWFIKRKPEGASFFRDGFPYLECNMPEGSLWVQTRKEACAFRTLKAARAAFKLARRFEKGAACIVRVERSTSAVPK